MPNHNLVAAVQLASAIPVTAAGATYFGSPYRWPNLDPLSYAKWARGSVKYVDHLHTLPSPLPPALVGELARYSAISSCLHLFAGWRFLAQAAHCLLNASRANALHLAYYAELRAAQSLLSMGGVGILKNKHYALTGSGGVEWFKGNTHEVVWEALVTWCASQSNARSVVSALNLESVFGVNWIDECKLTNTPEVVASEWLQHWAIDLEGFIDDRELRNWSSYRPDLTKPAFNDLATNELSFVRDLTAMYSDGGFPNQSDITRLLVADLVDKQAERHGVPRMQFWSGIAGRLRSTYGLNPEQTKEILDSLLRAKETPARRVWRAASRGNHDVLGVLARATFLLHLTSAKLGEMEAAMRTQAVGGRLDGFRTLLGKYGLQAGLWPLGGEPADHSVLMEDFLDSEMEIHEATSAYTSVNRFSLWSQHSPDMHALAQLERIPLAGLWT